MSDYEKRLWYALFLSIVKKNVGGGFASCYGSVSIDY